MSKDDKIWEALEEMEDNWLATIKSDMHRAVGMFILKQKSGKVERIHPVIQGGYNLIFRLEYQDGSSVAMKVPIKCMCFCRPFLFFCDNF
jgi:hypothetical protein